MNRALTALALLAFVALVLLKLFAGAPASEGAAAESVPSADARDDGGQLLEAPEDARERSATTEEAPVRPSTSSFASGRAEADAPLVRYRLVDAVTGAPVVGAAVHFGGSPFRIVTRASVGDTRSIRPYEPLGETTTIGE